MSARPGGYKPYQSLRRPGGSPDAKPAYRVLVKRDQAAAWDRHVLGCGLQSAQQCWDHLAFTPNRVPKVNSSTMLRGKNFRGKDGWSNRLHYRVGKAVRVDYEYHDAYTGGSKGDPHPVVRIVWVGRSTSGT